MLLLIGGSVYLLVYVDPEEDREQTRERDDDRTDAERRTVLNAQELKDNEDDACAFEWQIDLNDYRLYQVWKKDGKDSRTQKEHKQGEKLLTWEAMTIMADMHSYRFQQNKKYMAALAALASMKFTEPGGEGSESAGSASGDGAKEKEEETPVVLRLYTFCR